jgi:hypothetical protein
MHMMHPRRAMRRRFAAGPAVVLALAALGCVDTAGLDDRPCPCVGGFKCCDRTQDCVPPGQLAAMSCEIDGGVDGARDAAPDAAADLIADVVADLNADRGPPLDMTLPSDMACVTGPGACCSDQDCPQCGSCSAGKCQNQSVGQDGKNECAGRGCSAGRCRECLPADLPSCTGSTRRSCGADGLYQSENCEFGCAGTSCLTCATPVMCYRDQDKDNFGDPMVSRRGCTDCPTGYVRDNSDCYDLNAMAYPRGPTTGFDDWFDVHRGDGSFDYTCDTRIETSPPDPDRAVCVGVAPSCNIVRMSYDASKCGTLVLAFSCSCDPDCNVACRVLGGGSKLQVRCR